jgi:hypothetical protein
MKKKHGVFFGFAVLLTAAIFTLTGCDNGSTSSEDDSPKKLTVSGITNVSDNLLCFMLTSEPSENGNLVAGGYVSTAETVTVQLKNLSEGGNPDNTNTNWLGTGSYHILLWTGNGGVNGNGNPQHFTQEKVNFSSETTTVGWDKFQAVPGQ